jgi:hypothetical protein
MKIGNYLFPYPVLFPERTDVSGSFTGRVDYETTEDAIIIRASFSLENSDISELISSGKAVFCMDIVCSKTLFRESVTNTNPNIEHRVPVSEMRGKVECSLLVVATKYIAYTAKTHRADFGNETFYVERGDVIAYANTHVFLMEMSPEEMLKIGSFMRVTHDDSCNIGEIKIDLGTMGATETIDIKMSLGDFSNYSKTKDKYTPIYHSSLVLPALIHAITMLLNDREEEYAERMWAQIITERLNAKDLKYIERTNANIFTIANRILEWPLSKSINSLNDITLNRFTNDEE